LDFSNVSRTPKRNCGAVAKIGRKALPNLAFIKSGQGLTEESRLNAESRFSLAYDAAHSLALAALRWHGYRSENRHIVFQILGSTVSLPAAKWRFLDNCHQKRNRALYDGDYEEDEPLIRELIAVAKELQAAVEALGPVDA
jgi:hypothetical protein